MLPGHKQDQPLQPSWLCPEYLPFLSLLSPRIAGSPWKVSPPHPIFRLQCRPFPLHVPGQPFLVLASSSALPPGVLPWSCSPFLVRLSAPQFSQMPFLTPATVLVPQHCGCLLSWGLRFPTVLAHSTVLERTAAYSSRGGRTPETICPELPLRGRKPREG